MYKIIILPHFGKTLNFYAKKYRHIPEDVAQTLEGFRKDSAASLGQNVYKIRLRSRDLNKGKSKSFRLVVLVIEVENYLVPITIYFKGDQGDISKKEISDELEMIKFDLATGGMLKQF